MKPTQEQVIGWAREAGDCFRDDRGREEFIFDCYGIERLAILAYEAGRKDENEAFLKSIEENSIRFRDIQKAALEMAAEDLRLSAQGDNNDT